MIERKIITLCGSSKFKATFGLMIQKFRDDGHIPIGMDIFGHIDMPDIMDNNIKTKLDWLHMRKIDIADIIYIVNENGYIGESTKNEIEYAKNLGKEILYMEEIQ